VLDIAVGDELNRLYAGDSICFPSALQHRYVNPTDRDTRAITAILRDWKGAAPA
jgi:mannose-6-phosphate isomerase-like protein (cupin superfamily)